MQGEGELGSDRQVQVGATSCFMEKGGSRKRYWEVGVGRKVTSGLILCGCPSGRQNNCSLVSKTSAAVL